MRIRKHFSDDFKKQVARHYLTSDDSLQTTADKFGVKVHASVLQWVNKFGGEFRPLDMSKSPDKEKSVLPDTPEAMLLRIKLLEETLEHKQLENIALSKMIDIAERELKISIRKNSGAKQSKK
jgi:transposase-like protein